MIEKSILQLPNDIFQNMANSHMVLRKSWLFCASLILESVRITRELKDVTVTTGEDAVFRCEVSQTGVTNVEWWLGSNHLQNNDLNQISSQGREHSLVLKMVTPDDSGDVAFVVGCERTVASLMVKEKPKGKGSSACKSGTSLVSASERKKQHCVALMDALGACTTTSCCNVMYSINLAEC